MNHHPILSIPDQALLGVQVLIPDLHFDLIKVEGTEATSYLQGQTTQDISRFPLGHPFSNCVLNHGGTLSVYFSQKKIAENAWELVVSSEHAQKLFERINQFIISEDVVVLEPKRINGNLYLGPLTKYFNHESTHFEYLGVRALITESKISSWFSNTWNSIQEWRVFEHSQGFKIDTNKSPLYTNTILSEFTLSLTKGCYLGQETVAKIISRKGASHYPTLLSSFEKTHPAAFIHRGQFYALDFLPRELRIPGKLLDETYYNMSVTSAPIIPFEQKSQALELYHLLLNLSQNDSFLGQAIIGLQLYTNIFPSHEDAWEMLGLLLSRLKRYDESIEAFESLNKLNPNSVMACVNLSRIYGEMGKIKEAEDYKAEGIVRSFYANAAAANNPPPAEVVKHDDAKIKMFLDVLEIDPDDKFALYQLGLIYLDHQDFDKLELQLLKLNAINIIKSDPEFALLFFALKHHQSDPLCGQFLELGIEHAAKLGKQKVLQELLAQQCRFSK